MKIHGIVALFAACCFCASAFSDPVGYVETFDNNNLGWGTDEDYLENIFTDTSGVSWDSDLQAVYARYPQVIGARTLTTVIYADITSSDPAGILAGNVDYTSVPGLSVWLRTSTETTVPAVTFFLASNNDTVNSTLSTSSSIFQYNFQAQGLGTSWTQFTCTDFAPTSWTTWRNPGSLTLAQALADVDAVGVMYFDAGQTQHDLYVDNFAATPEPATLMMMGPAAGFLGWKLNRRRKRQPARSR